MADSQPPAQAPAGESAENLHTDPVTGEKISKSELKRRTKQREKDEKKKEKEAALPARPKKEGKKDDEEELNPNVRVHPLNGAYRTDRRSNTSRSAPTRSMRCEPPSSPTRTPTSSSSTPNSSTLCATMHTSRRARRCPTRRSASVCASSPSGRPPTRCTSTSVCAPCMYTAVGIG
jgi:hypothetical protein